MAAPRWLDAALVLALHDELTAAFGGASEVRDLSLLESAIDRAANLFHYRGGSSIFELAAALCSGIARNHPFVDGNKRTALVAAHVFLHRNGWSFEPAEAETVATMVDLAAGRVDEATLASWMEANSQPLSGPPTRRLR